MKKLISLIICLVVLAGCAPTDQQIQAAIEKTNQAKAAIEEPITAASSTLQPEPTNTPQPTNTPKPSNTPKPTWTKSPVPTSTPIPEPVTLTGTGDSIIDYDNSFNAAFVHITYGAGGYFMVKNLDANNEAIDLLVNQVGAYDGYRPLDFNNDEHTKRFEVKASGDWVITVYPMVVDYYRLCDIPATCSGKGDDVIVLRGPQADTIKFDYPGDSYIGVFAYGGPSYDLLVNEVGPYSGTLLVGNGRWVLEIVAVGEWTAVITVK